MITGHGGRRRRRLMTPVEQAKAVYDKEPCARSFKEDLELHMLNGYVFSTPTAFIMGRPVNKDAREYKILHPEVSFHRDYCNAWFIYLAAGDMAEFFNYEPFKLPYFGWEKRGRVRFHPRTVVLYTADLKQ